MMTDLSAQPSRSPAPAGMSPDEWHLRLDLAACYRLFHHFRFTDLIYNHISARVGGEHEHFLINPYGLMYDEVTASSLVKVDVNGRVIEDPLGLGVNPGGFTIHSAVHRARPDVLCVMHTHSAATVAVATMECGLLPLTQHSMRFTGRIAYHDYEGIYFTDEERQRLQANLGQRMVMLLRNHGSLVCGRSISDAFDTMYYLERACQLQLSLLASGRKLVEPAPEVAEQVAAVFESPTRQGAQKTWPAMLRLLEREQPDYQQ
ncbi:MAG: class II aldolase/adducin family protein [Betaproteobacteria bacterium]